MRCPGRGEVLQLGKASDELYAQKAVLETKLEKTEADVEEFESFSAVYVHVNVN